MTLRVRPKLTLYDITSKDLVSASKKEGGSIYIVTKKLSKRYSYKDAFMPKISHYLFHSLLANGLITLIQEYPNWAVYRFVEDLPKEYGATRITISDIIW